MKKQKRLLALLLSVLMLVSSMPMAWAESEIVPEETAAVVAEVTTEAPVEVVTEAPTEVPTEAATEAPTEAPAEVATEAPTEAPVEVVTEAPTEAPAEVVTEAPTEAPAEVVTEAPTEAPTEAATEAPTEAPDVFVPGYARLGGGTKLFETSALQGEPSTLNGQAVVYAEKRTDDKTAVKVALFDGETVVEKWVKAERVAMLSAAEIEQYETSCEADHKDAYKPYNGCLLLPAVILTPAPETEAPVVTETPVPDADEPDPTNTAVPTDAPPEAPTAVPVLLDGEVVEDVVSRSPLRATGLKAARSSATVGDWLTFTTQFTGSGSIAWIEYHIYNIYGQHLTGYRGEGAGISGVYHYNTAATGAGRYCARVYLMAKDGTFSHVDSEWVTVTSPNSLRVTALNPASMTANVGDWLTFTTQFSGSVDTSTIAWIEYHIYNIYGQHLTGYRGEGAGISGVYHYDTSVTGAGKYCARVYLMCKDGTFTHVDSPWVEVTNQVRYRALLIGNTYPGTSSALSGPDNDAYAMRYMLNRMTGTPYTVTTRINATASGIKSAIASAFAGATANDVSLFYYSGHGLQAYNSAYHGALCGINDTYLTISELRTALDQIPGKKIVLLDSCFSGQAIGKAEGTTDEVTNEMMSAFNSSVISQFSAADKAAMARSNLATNNYFVITAAHSTQTSLSVKATTGKWMGLFTYVTCFGSGWDEAKNTALNTLGADRNGDNKISLNEAYSFTYSNVLGMNYSQLTQVYPSGSSFVLWGK